MGDALGIDFGTSGVRGCVIDASGRTRAGSAAALPAPERDGPAVEQSPEHWWSAFEAVMDRLAAAGALGRVERLAVDGTASTLLLCDAGGRPLTPALMYNDARATPVLDRIREAAPAASPVHSASASLAKLLWLLQRYPASRPVHAVHQSDWILGRLTGRFDASDENNALKLGYDCERRRWPDWLQGLGLPEDVLPSVYPAGTPVAGLAARHRQRWGLPEDVAVCVGTTDSTAAVLATGINAIGDAVSVLGSTLVLKVLAPRPVVAAEYGIYSHRLGDRWLAGGASNAGGAVLRQFFTDEAMVAMTPRLDPEQVTDLDYYPLPAPGERFPVNDPGLQPRLSPRPASDVTFFQGLLEGLARIEHAGYQRLAGLGAPYPAQVVSSGGGARNAAWRRIRERLLGCPVSLATEQEAAYGSARLAQGLVAGD